MMNPMIHFFKQLSGKINPSVFASVSNPQDAANIAFLRQLQREMKEKDVLQVPFSKLKVVVFDLETTGFYPQKGDYILSIGAVRVIGEKVIENETYYSLVHSDQEIPHKVKDLTGITEEELRNAPSLHQVLQEFYRFVKSEPLVAHHAKHEKNFMQHATWSSLKMHFQHRLLDTSFLTNIVEKEKKLVTLDECCEHFGITINNRHHALHDAFAAAKLWTKNIQLIQKEGFSNLLDVYTHLGTKDKQKQ